MRSVLTLMDLHIVRGCFHSDSERTVEHFSGIRGARAQLENHTAKPAAAVFKCREKHKKKKGGTQFRRGHAPS